ncbi:MAG: NAD-dependent epimerase/dehydratase family protein [Vicinamibacterales bacterium]
MNDRIFVTGATGFIGGSVAQRLAAAGKDIRGLTRSPEGAALLESLGIRPVVGQLSDAALLAQEARAADVVINAADADDREAVDTLIQALAGTGKTLIHTSGSSIVTDDAGGEPGDAVYTDIPEHPVPGKAARVAIDRRVLAAAAVNIRSVVICPTMIYGPGRGPTTQSQQIPALLRHARAAGISHYVGRGLNRWSNVHIDDVTELYVLALHKAAPGSFFFAENGEATLLEIARGIARHLGVSGPDSLSLEAASQVWEPAAVRYGFGSNSRVRAERARQDLGWSARHSSIFHDLPREAGLYRT